MYNSNDEKLYLGLSFGFNASACLVSDKRGLLAAISQERLSGVKNTKELPIDAAIKCCEISGVDKVYEVVYSHYQYLSTSEVIKYCDEERKKMLCNFEFFYESDKKNAEDLILYFIEKSGIEVEINELARFQHHAAHLFSAFGIYGIPKGDYIGITSDGFGDGMSGTIVFKHNGKSEILSNVKTRNSVALVYQFTTGALGYKMHQHEGKITGLAAYGKPLYLSDYFNLFNEVAYDNGLEYDERKSDELTQEDKELIEQNAAIDDFEGFLKLKKSVFKLVDNLKKNGANNCDIAASVQEFAEMVTINWIERALKFKIGFHDLIGKVDCYLAGGLFANVKLNQKVHETKLFRELYVSPPMGDEGTCIGAAILEAMNNGHYEDLSDNFYHDSTDYIFAGTSIYRDVTTIGKKLEEFKNECSYEVIQNEESLVNEVVRSLKNKEIVCLCRDRMEYGPRALCHRSILYDCTDKSVNDWLNKQLGRTEFMPFAPVLLEKNFEELFYNTKGAKETSRFMTITFKCKKEFVENYPAACHVDKTARPQIVNERTDSFMTKVLEKYEAVTGNKVLINTSFNLHNYPIIESPEVAIESWIKSKTDVLVIGRLVIRRK